MWRRWGPKGGLVRPPGWGPRLILAARSKLPSEKTEKCNSIVNVAGYITRGGGYGRAEKTNGFTHIQEIESKLKIGLSNIAQNLSQLLWRDLLN